MGFYFYSFIIIVIAVIILSGFSSPPPKSIYYLHNKLSYRRETKETRNDFLKGLPTQ